MCFKLTFTASSNLTIRIPKTFNYKSAKSSLLHMFTFLVQKQYLSVQVVINFAMLFYSVHLTYSKIV